MPETKKAYFQTRGPDFTPRLDDEKYWQSHAIYIAQIVKVKLSPKVNASLKWKILKTISGSGILTTTVAFRNLYVIAKIDGVERRNPSEDLKAGTQVLVFETREKKEPIVITTIEDINTNFLIKNLENISSINQHPTPKNLLEGSISADNLVAEYCLRILVVAGEKISIESANIIKLKSQANDEKRSATVQMLSYQLSQSERSIKNEHAWLRDKVSRNKRQDWRKIRPFITRMAELRSCREESILFLTELVLNQTASLASRVAAYSILQDPRLFDYFNPDKESERIFMAMLKMLKDPTPQIRSAGAAILRGISACIIPFKRRPFLRRAMEGMQQALATETDAATKSHFDVYLKYLTHRGSHSS